MFTTHLVTIIQTFSSLGSFDN